MTDHDATIKTLTAQVINQYIDDQLTTATAAANSQRDDARNLLTIARNRVASLETQTDAQAEAMVQMAERIRALEVLLGQGGNPPAINRDSLVYGTYIPSAATTGVLPGTVLADYNDPTTDVAVIPNNTTLIENKRIYGDIRWNKATDLLIRNCELVGGSNIPATTTAIVDCNPAHTGYLTLTDCTIKAREPRNRDGIMGHKYRGIRLNVSNVVGALSAFVTTARGTDADVVLLGNWVHDLAYINPDYQNGVSGAAWHADGSRNDGLQILGGKVITVRGNFLDLRASVPHPSNTASNLTRPWLSMTNQTNGYGLIVQETSGNTLDDTVVVEENYFAGGLAQTYLRPNLRFIFRNNKHYRNTAVNNTGTPGNWPGFFIRVDQRTGLQVTGLNTSIWQDGPYVGAALDEPRDKGIHYNA